MSPVAPIAPPIRRNTYRPACSLRWRAHGKVYGIVLTDHVPAGVWRSRLGHKPTSHALLVALKDDGTLDSIVNGLSYADMERQVRQAIDRWEVL